MPRSSLPSLVLAALVASPLLGCGGGGKHPSASNDGVVRTAYTQVPLTNATVNFFDRAGTAVGSAAVAASGKIVGTIPTSATQFVVDPSTSSVGGPYYTTFLYNKVYYSPVVGCYAPLPSTGSAALKEDVVFFLMDSNTPPPPPDSCTAS